MNLLFASAVGIRAKCQCCRLVFQHITRRELRSHVLEEASQVGIIFRLNSGKFKMIRSRLLLLLSLGQSIRAGRSLKKWTRLWDLLLSLNQQTWISRTVDFIVLLKTDAVSHHFAIQVFVVADSSVRIRVAHWTWMSSKRLNQTRSLRHDCPIQRGHNNSVQFDHASYLFIYIYIHR